MATRTLGHLPRQRQRLGGHRRLAQVFRPSPGHSRFSGPASDGHFCPVRPVAVGQEPVRHGGWRALAHDERQAESDLELTLVEAYNRYGGTFVARITDVGSATFPVSAGLICTCRCHEQLVTARSSGESQTVRNSESERRKRSWDVAGGSRVFDAPEPERRSSPRPMRAHPFGLRGATQACCRGLGRKASLTPT
jgi:hypothetical protein